jgi:2-polyprenyl-3-methyl-5-hydroxy-6-metoxy-1,4-benzoquinol methylase
MSKMNSELRELLSLLGPNDNPNTNDLIYILRNINSLSLTVKFFGYELARSLAAALPPRTSNGPVAVGLASKPSTQADIASDWAAHWCSQLKIPVVFHRKVWELAYVLQAIYEHGSIAPGARGLGFGCGTEPLPSYLASQGVSVTVTDLDPDEVKGKGWANTNQHTSSIDLSFHPHLVSRAAFDEHVDLKYVDMNRIDAALSGYDFCWSICAFEHLGSIENGLDFVKNSMKTLRPGGVSVHTTEFNFTNNERTIDNWPTVLFQRRHFERLARDLEAMGHTVAPMSFDVGDLPLDKFIDIPPYLQNWTKEMKESWSENAPHIKLTVDGFPVTCFGIVIRKGGE